MTPADGALVGLPNLLMAFGAAVLGGVFLPGLGLVVLARSLRRAAAVV